MGSEEKEKQRRIEKFEKRIAAEGVDVWDYAHAEGRAREKLTGEKGRISKKNEKDFRGSEVTEIQTIEAVKYWEALGKDSKTGAYNHKKFEEEIARLQEDAERRRKRHELGRERKTEMQVLVENPFSLIMFDIDHFKKINDTYGHGAGDAVLREIVARCQKRLRSGDAIFRYGGEEFMIIELATNGTAAVLAHALKKLISETPFEINDNKGTHRSITVTVSFGISSYDESSVEMIKQADTAMYAAKKAGRDQIWFMQKTGDRVMCSESKI